MTQKGLVKIGYNLNLSRRDNTLLTIGEAQRNLRYADRFSLKINTNL
jgi:hypothetical protein